MPRSSLRPESALTPRLLRREAIQLGVAAVVASALLLTGSSALHIVSAVVSIAAGALAAIAGIVGWRVGGLQFSLLLYPAAVVVFAALAFAAVA